MYASEVNNESQATTTSAASSIPYAPPHHSQFPVEDTIQPAIGTPDPQIGVSQAHEADLEMQPEIPYSGGPKEISGAEDKPLGAEDSYFICIQDSQQSELSELSEISYEARLNAFRAALGNIRGDVYREISLISATDNHSKPEPELGGG